MRMSDADELAHHDVGFSLFDMYYPAKQVGAAENDSSAEVKLKCCIICMSRTMPNNPIYSPAAGSGVTVVDTDMSIVCAHVHRESNQGKGRIVYVVTNLSDYQ